MHTLENANRFKLIYKPLIFVSSTNEDLVPDCRPSVCKAVSRAGGIVVAQENFVYTSSRQHALEYCLRRIEEESTHYIGIFAHRLGWIPDNVPSEYEVYRGISITQAEYYHAKKMQLEPAIFIPRPGTVLDTELKQRAQTQTSEEFKKQQKFIKSLMGQSLVNLFDDEIDLAINTTVIVLAWQRIGPRTLLQFSREKPLRTVQQVNCPTPPKKEKLTMTAKTLTTRVFDVGHHQQLKQFIVNRYSSVSIEGHSSSAFMVYGPENYGHEHVAQRFQTELGTKGDVVQSPSNIIHLGRGSRKDLQSLLNRFEDATFSPHTIFELAKSITEKLSTQHVMIIIDVSNIRYFERGIDGFIRQFWHSLASKVPKSQPHELIMLLIHRGNDLSPDWDKYWQRDSGPFDPQKIVKLDQLANFDHNDIQMWIDRYCGKNAQYADLAAEILKRTQGRPLDVYQELAEIEATG